MWKEFEIDNKSMLLNLRRADKTVGTPGKARKTVFKSMSRKINGTMGMGNRRRLPQCVEDNVRKMLMTRFERKLHLGKVTLGKIHNTDFDRWRTSYTDLKTWKHQCDFRHKMDVV